MRKARTRRFEANEVTKPSWKNRRRVIIFTLLFCAGSTIYLMAFSKDTEVNQTIANGIILLAISVIGSYVFGATWDDMNVMNKIGHRAYRTEHTIEEEGEEVRKEVTESSVTNAMPEPAPENKKPEVFLEG